jgi:hypothetical protein
MLERKLELTTNCFLLFDGVVAQIFDHNRTCSVRWIVSWDETRAKFIESGVIKVLMLWN